MRILMAGAGVIGSVYAGRLLQAGHVVVMLARGERLADLQQEGLILEEAQSGRSMRIPVSAVASVSPDHRFDLAIVAAQRDQMTGLAPAVSDLDGDPDVLFFGNALGLTERLSATVGERALFGFPAAGGVRDGPAVRYVLINQQKTMLGGRAGQPSGRVRALQAAFRQAGFATTISSSVEGWLRAHTAFILPIAFALYRAGTDATRLARDPSGLRTMVRATRQAFRALRTAEPMEIPRNVAVLYLAMPEAFAVRYWRRVLASPRGELWFAAHTRAAPQEMTSLARELLAIIHLTGLPTPDLDALLTIQ
jgi:2-dehydropantoate 2-reductase